VDRLSFNFVLWFLKSTGYKTPRNLSFLSDAILSETYNNRSAHVNPKRFTSDVAKWTIKSAECSGVDLTGAMNKLLRDTHYQYLHLSKEVPLNDIAYVGELLSGVVDTGILKIDGLKVDVAWVGGKLVLGKTVHINPPAGIGGGSSGGAAVVTVKPPTPMPAFRQRTGPRKPYPPPKPKTMITLQSLIDMGILKRW
jgi:hypothetical protein